MKKLLATFIVICLFSLSSTMAIGASGLTNSASQQTKGGDQVLVKDENGVLYLSTETVDGEQSLDDASYSGTRSRYLLLEDGRLRLPKGFATSVGGLLNSILSFVMVISALLVFFYLIWGGMDWIMSGGDKGKTDKAREKIMAAVIGLIIVASAYAILNLIVRLLGFDNFNDVITNTTTIQGDKGVIREIGAESRLGELNQATPSATPNSNQ